MRLTVTVARLEGLGACAEALALFREHYGDQATAEWTAEKQLEVLRGPLGRYVGWAVENKLLPLWSMADANLAGANLARAYLADANLARANLAGAYLAGANLVDANLADANLAGANLARANLADANLAGANLAGAYLASANLAGARVCLCNNGLCVRLREALAVAGWVPGDDGLLARATATATAPQE
jgi:hypothetical protein